MEIQQKVQVPDFHVIGEVTTKCPDWAVKGAPAADRHVIYVTASSTSPDLEGDRMSDRAEQQMAAGFVGLTIFLNHRYSWPEDVFGVVLRTRLVERDGFVDLDMEIAVADDNPRAVQAYNLIKSGVRAGVSVGVIVLSYHTSEEEHNGRQIVILEEVLPLEASICGIPANQRSWVHEAVKSLVDTGRVTLSCDALGCRPWLKSAAVEVPTMTMVVKGAVPYKKFPLAPRDAAWDVKAAESAIRELCGGPDKDKMDWAAYRQYFGWFDPENQENFAGYKLLHHRPETVFKACAAVAVVLAGGRGGVNIPDADVDGVKAHIGKHYKEFKEEAPWDRDEKDFQWLPIELEAAKDLDLDLDDALKALTETDDEPANEPEDEPVVSDDALLACACGQHPEHMSEDEIVQTAAVRMLASGIAAGAPVPDEDEDEDEDEPDEAAKSERRLASLRDELAEADARERFWRVTYAFCDAVWDIVEHMAPEERDAALEALLTEYHDIILEVMKTIPPKADADRGAPDEDVWAVAESVLRTLMRPEDVGVIDNAAVSDDNGTAVTAQIDELRSNLSTVEDERDALKEQVKDLQGTLARVGEMLDEILNEPRAFKTQMQSGGSLRDTARRIQERRYPELSKFVERLINTERSKE